MNVLITKLEQFVRLSSGDRAVLVRAMGDRPRRFAPRADVLREGDPPREPQLVLSGWACRYKQLEDGRRQILSLFLPGDVFDLNGAMHGELDHSVGTISAVTLLDLPRGLFEQAAIVHPRLAAAFAWSGLVAAAIQREWTMNLGVRSAYERMAHLLCELFFRLRPVGLIRDNACEFPLTQADLADATGLSKVHVNRTLQELRSAELIVLRGKMLVVSDLARLMDAALFNPNYLHLDREGRHLDANEASGSAPASCERSMQTPMSA